MASNRLTRSAKSFFVLFVLASIAAPSAFSFQVEVATAPASSLSLTLSAIQRAQKSILINIYELTSPEIVQAIVDQVNRGVHVELLQEGQPVIPISAKDRALQSKIIQAMTNYPGNRYVQMVRGTKGKRRFRFDHAKYIVTDGSQLLIGSENYSPSGQPTPGTLGNRGWEVLVHDPAPSRWFTQLFARDSDARHSDIQNMLSSRLPRSNVFSSISGPSTFAKAAPAYEATSGVLVTSPETSLDGIVGLIQSARQTLDIEQMSFPYYWRTVSASAQGSAAKSVSPVAQAILEAARRGVKVRILLNDERAFGGNTHDDPPDHEVEIRFASHTNADTARELNTIAESENLDLEVRIANVKAMGVTYIHNKGVMVDQDQTLISSINWTQNSVQNNREAGVILTSPQIRKFFQGFFNQDWARSQN